jgi:hypothetical protein
MNLSCNKYYLIVDPEPLLQVKLNKQKMLKRKQFHNKCFLHKYYYLVDPKQFENLVNITLQEWSNFSMPLGQAHYLPLLLLWTGKQDLSGLQRAICQSPGKKQGP